MKATRTIGIYVTSKHTDNIYKYLISLLQIVQVATLHLSFSCWVSICVFFRLEGCQEFLLLFQVILDLYRFVNSWDREHRWVYPGKCERILRAIGTLTDRDAGEKK